MTLVRMVRQTDIADIARVIVIVQGPSARHFASKRDGSSLKHREGK